MSDYPTTLNNNHMKNKKKEIVELIEYLVLYVGVVSMVGLIIYNLLIH